MKRAHALFRSCTVHFGFVFGACFGGDSHLGSGMSPSLVLGASLLSSAGLLVLVQDPIHQCVMKLGVEFFLVDNCLLL